MDINKIIIAGAGTMGYSIAEIFAEFGYQIILYDISEKALEDAKEYINLNTKNLIEEEGKSQEYADNLLNKISYTTDTTAFADADLIIECIVENLEIKKTFYENISSIVPEDAILATNTSGISITEIGKSVKNPNRFIGMHWFNPSHLVLLIEIIKGEHTDEQTAQTIHSLCIKIKKQPVIVHKDVPGFAANRIQFAILRESLHLVEQGVVDIEGIDDIMKYGLGFRYACTGPLQVADFGGLDTFYHISEYLMKDLCADKDVPPLLEKLYKEGNYGVKTKKGFYDYSNGKDQEAISQRNEKLMRLFKALYAK